MTSARTINERWRSADGWVGVVPSVRTFTLFTMTMMNKLADGLEIVECVLLVPSGARDVRRVDKAGAKLNCE